MHFIAGIFVGGRASRMGGIAKGLLAAPGGDPIVVRTRRLVASIGGTCVLVGAHPAYAGLGLPLLADDPAAEGPLAALLALLSHAGDRRALALACDMPFLSAELLTRLAREQPDAPVLAPRRAAAEKGRDVWEPLFARYDARAVLPIARELAARGTRSLQVLLDAAGTEPLCLRPEEVAELEDWDTLPGATPRERKGS
jgi:molybdopterin-guanine dinucleotide biosynthesis protein A